MVTMRQALQVALNDEKAKVAKEKKAACKKRRRHRKRAQKVRMIYTGHIFHVLFGRDLGYRRNLRQPWPLSLKHPRPTHLPTSLILLSPRHALRSFPDHSVNSTMRFGMIVTVVDANVNEGLSTQYASIGRILSFLIKSTLQLVP